MPTSSRRPMRLFGLAVSSAALLVPAAASAATRAEVAGENLQVTADAAGSAVTLSGSSVKLATAVNQTYVRVADPNGVLTSTCVPDAGSVLCAFDGLKRIIFTGGAGADSVKFLTASPIDRAVHLPLAADGGAGNDTLSGGYKNDALMGGPGADLLSGFEPQTAGTGDADVAFTGDESGLTERPIHVGGEEPDGDADVVHGDVERVEAGAGNDTFTILRPGRATVSGGDGTDTASFERVAEPVTASVDGAAVIGSTAAQTLQVEGLRGGAGDDVLTGSDRADTLEGGAGHDQLSGLAGPDAIFGGDGDDTIGGGADGDTLVGGAGLDSVDAGEGDDDIALRDDAADGATCGNGADTVTADAIDAADTSCETVSIPMSPGDGDGEEERKKDSGKSGGSGDGGEQAPVAGSSTVQTAGASSAPPAPSATPGKKAARMELLTKGKGRRVIVLGRILAVSAGAQEDSAGGCAAGGKVRVKLTRAGTLIGTREVQLRRDCAFRAVAKSAAGVTGEVTVQVRFLGNTALKGARRSEKFRVRG